MGAIIICIYVSLIALVAGLYYYITDKKKEKHTED